MERRWVLGVVLIVADAGEQDASSVLIERFWGGGQTQRRREREVGWLVGSRKRFQKEVSERGFRKRFQKEVGWMVWF